MSFHSGISYEAGSPTRRRPLACRLQKDTPQSMHLAAVLAQRHVGAGGGTRVMLDALGGRGHGWCAARSREIGIFPISPLYSLTVSGRLPAGPGHRSARAAGKRRCSAERAVGAGQRSFEGGEIFLEVLRIRFPLESRGGHVAPSMRPRRSRVLPGSEPSDRRTFPCESLIQV
jgi:hypothetical protein